MLTISLTSIFSCPQKQDRFENQTVDAPFSYRWYSLKNKQSTQLSKLSQLQKSMYISINCHGYSPLISNHPLGNYKKNISSFFLRGPLGFSLKKGLYTYAFIFFIFFSRTKYCIGKYKVNIPPFEAFFQREPSKIKLKTSLLEPLENDISSKKGSSSDEATLRKQAG